MPLRTPRLSSATNESSAWGPWHVPCSHAYLVFHAGRSDEALELRMVPETAADVKDAARRDCAADGRNYAMADI